MRFLHYNLLAFFEGHLDNVWEHLTYFKVKIESYKLSGSCILILSTR